MNTLAASEIKRRGIGAVDSLLDMGPVHIIKNNIPNYVVISEENYQQMLSDLAESRLAASDNDIKAGHVRKGTLKQLMAEIEG
jgi:PHD/YefM family antitoxin component YafN of YafNO toxin-antitoxin module